MKGRPRIAALRAYVVAGAGADYHDQAEGHWIDGQIATPMSRYADYRATRSACGAIIRNSANGVSTRVITNWYP